jgi:hypothetical protein
MRLLLWLISALLCGSALCLRVLKGEEIPADYPTGRIMHVSFTSDGRLFFRSAGNVLGFIERGTGSMQSMFVLEESEEIVDYWGHEEFMISKGKTINLLSPAEEKYVRLQYSDYL